MRRRFTFPCGECEACKLGEERFCDNPSQTQPGLNTLITDAGLLTFMKELLELCDRHRVRVEGNFRLIGTIQQVTNFKAADRKSLQFTESSQVLGVDEDE